MVTNKLLQLYLCYLKNKHIVVYIKLYQYIPTFWYHYYKYRKCIPRETAFRKQFGLFCDNTVNKCDNNTGLMVKMFQS